MGGRKERKMRACFARGEKGLKVVVTSVRKRVFIVELSSAERRISSSFNDPKLRDIPFEVSWLIIGQFS